MTVVRNIATPEGHALGAELARLADSGEPAVRLVEPDHPCRCTTCAFRLGTKPNGMAPTLMSAVKAAIEQTGFYCHERKEPDGSDSLCAGWLFLMGPLPWPEPGRAPWEHPEPAERP